MVKYILLDSDTHCEDYRVIGLKLVDHRYRERMRADNM